MLNFYELVWRKLQLNIDMRFAYALMKIGSEQKKTLEITSDSCLKAQLVESFHIPYHLPPLGIKSSR